MDFKIELIPLAVQDVDRSVEFYGTTVGWNVDHDRTVSPDLRFVQVTPPGSACSICFGVGLEMMPTGSSQYIQVVVDDADEALGHLRERGVMDEGVPVLGYIHWTLLDNFEWVFGHKHHKHQLGLHEVDRETFERTPKPSAGVYAALVKAART